MKLFTAGYNGALEPTTLLTVLVCVGPALVLLWIVLLALDERKKLPPWLACALFHRKHRIPTLTTDGGFTKCEKCGRTHHWNQ